jgi:hypothetical protein
MVQIMHTWQMLLHLIVINDGQMDIGGSCITFLNAMIILLNQKELNVGLEWNAWTENSHVQPAKWLD